MTESCPLGKRSCDRPRIGGRAHPTAVGETEAVKDWSIDELAHAGAEHLDPAYVTAYEHKAGFDPREDLDVLRRLGLGRASTVVDFGAGTGVFAIAVAAHCRHVIALDISPAMTAVLRARVRDLSVTNLTVMDAGFLSYDHHGPPADFVYTRNALHHFPDFWKAIALDRIATILRPGGVLRLRDLIYNFEPSEADRHIDAWLSGAVTDPAVGYTAEELAVHVRDEYSTYRWLLDMMLERTGFTIIDSDFHRSAYGTYTCQKASP
jgi:SAM-dependent methyltransferase